MKLFQIVIASPSLRIKDLNVALTLAVGSEKIKTYEDIYKNLYKSDFYGNNLRNLSWLFLVIQKGYVYFIHRTARDFLLINNSADCRSNRQWKGSLNEEDAHGLMWNICSILLRLCPNHKLSEPLGEFDVYYAVKNWANHYRRQSAQAAERSIPDARICCLKTWKRFCMPWGGPFYELLKLPLDSNLPSDIRRLEMFSVVAFDLQPVFLHILHHEKLSIEELNYALQLACCHARPSWVERLIDSGASPLPEFYMKHCSPLVLACTNYAGGPNSNSSKIIDTVLKGAVNFDWHNSDGDTGLHRALFVDNWSVVRLLIDLGANIKLTNNEGETPSHVATKSANWLGMLININSLCSKGATVDADDSSGPTALGLLVTRIEKGLHDFKDGKAMGAAYSVFRLLGYQTNASHPSVKENLELLKARTEWLKGMFDEYEKNFGINNFSPTSVSAFIKNRIHI